MLKEDYSELTFILKCSDKKELPIKGAFQAKKKKKYNEGIELI